MSPSTGDGQQSSFSLNLLSSFKRQRKISIYQVQVQVPFFKYIFSSRCMEKKSALILQEMFLKKKSNQKILARQDTSLSTGERETQHGMTHLTYAAHTKTDSWTCCENAPSGAHSRAQLNILSHIHGKGHAGANTPLLPHQVGEKGGLKEAMSRAREPLQALRAAPQPLTAWGYPCMLVASREETYHEYLQAWYRICMHWWEEWRKKSTITEHIP